MLVPVSTWRVVARGTEIAVSHVLEDEEGPLWSGVVELWRGAPSVESDPELFHGFMAIENPLVHQGFLLHVWNYDVPDYWGDQSNLGDEHRRYFTLRAVGSWTLTLRLPIGTPQFVWRAIARGFKATLLPKETPMHPAGPNQTPKPASLSRGEVPAPQPLPSPASEGAKSIIAPSS